MTSVNGGVRGDCPFVGRQVDGRYLREAAGQADMSRMMLRHLRSIRLSRAELHLCLLC